MKPIPLISFLLLACYISSFAQITNVRKWRKSEIDSLDNGLFLFDEGNFVSALPIFEDILSNHPKEEFIKYTYAKCAFYRSDKHEDAYKYLSEIYSKNKKIPDIKYDMALGALYTDKFDEAREYLNLFDKVKRRSPEEIKKAQLLSYYIDNAKYYYSRPSTAKVTNLGETVNTEDEEYAPSITADEAALIFTYSGPKSIGDKQNVNLTPDPYGVYMEDIYMTYKLENEFTTAFPLDSINSNASDRALSISHDGRILFTYKDEGDGHGDIYQSFLMGDLYSEPRKMRGQINSFSWEGSCSLSADGKTIYFSSDRSGGYGGKDIYRASLSADSTWGNIVNLGDSINTMYDEDAPFIHADGKTLFFSSNGSWSMGGYDIFKSRMNRKDSTFKNRGNVGFPINSTDDDIYFVLAANGNSAYYSSGKKGGKGLKDLYAIEPNFKGPKPNVYLVKGKTQLDGEGVEANIKVEIISNKNKEFSSLRSNSSNGTYLFSLPSGAYYKITYKIKNLPAQTVAIDALDDQGFVEEIHDIDFDSKVDTNAVILASTDKLPNVPVVPTKTVAVKPIVTNTLNAVITPTVVKTTSVVANATQTKTTVIAKVEVKETPLPTPPKPVVVKTESINVKEVKPIVKNESKLITDTFVPQTKLQVKAVTTIEKYGNSKADGLEFRVQIAAFKTGKSYAYPQLLKYGKIEPILLGDGLTRLYLGGAFETLSKAFELTKKVVSAGHKDVFVSAFYKGKRYTYDELERQGVLK